MDSTQEIIALIQCLETQHQKLNTEQTLKIVQAYRAISKDPILIDKVIDLIVLYSTQEQYANSLTTRQNQILNLIGLNFSSREISEILSISESTVGTHRKNIIRKLGLSGPGQLQKYTSQYIQLQKE